MLFARLKYLGEFWQVMGPGAEPLVRRIDMHLDRAFDDDEFEDNPDIPIETDDDIRRWMLFPWHRANLIEVYLANDEVTLAEEDSLLISPQSRQRAEDAVLASRE